MISFRGQIGASRRGGGPPLGRTPAPPGAPASLPCLIPPASGHRPISSRIASVRMVPGERLPLGGLDPGATSGEGEPDDDESAHEHRHDGDDHVDGHESHSLPKKDRT